MPYLLGSIGRRALLFLQSFYTAETEGRKAERMKTVICPICGTEYQTNKPNKKYCSFACKEAGERLQRTKWEARNAGYMAEYMKAYRRKEKANNGN